MAIGRVQVGSCIIRELGKHVRSSAGELDFDMRGGRVARHSPVARQLEMRVSQTAYDFGDFDTEPQWPVFSILHFGKAQALETLLKEVVHVLAAAFTVRYHIQPGVHLISYGPANEFVGLLPGQRRLP